MRHYHLSPFHKGTALSIILNDPGNRQKHLQFITAECENFIEAGGAYPGQQYTQNDLTGWPMDLYTPRYCERGCQGTLRNTTMGI